MWLQQKITNIKNRSQSFSSRQLAAAALIFAVIGTIIVGLSFADTNDFSNILDNPINPSNLTNVGFGEVSDWIQPWRAYMDTVPSSALTDAVGINFNVNGNSIEPTARLLAANGFKRARIEIGWNNMSYDNPTQLDPARQQVLQQYITTFKKYGIRPLILLNANSSGPVPAKTFPVVVTQGASVGDTTIKVDQTTAQQIRPNYSGSRFNEGRAGQAKYRFTKVASDGTVTLSQPLDAAVTAGTYNSGATQKFLPWFPPTKDDGTPSPEYNETMNGWLNYVGATTKAVKQYYGSDDFDVEVWNELSFGSAFLNAANYYSPMPAGYSKGHDNRNNILTDTINYLRNPANGVPNIKIGNGFTNQAPWGSGVNQPVGLNAIDKHPYYGLVRRPYQGQAHYPIDALGERDPTAVLGCWQKSNLTQPVQWTDTNGNGKLDQADCMTSTDAYGYVTDKAPKYNLLQPEAPLNGVTTESLIRDLAPFDNSVQGTMHGRYTKPCPTCDPPVMWITEVNLGPSGGAFTDPSDPDFKAVQLITLSPEEKRHIATKDYLRYLTAYVNKGVKAIDFYAANAGDLSVIDQSYFSQLNANDIKHNPSYYPGDNSGGLSLAAIKNLTDIMKQGATNITQPRQLTLTRIADNHNHMQFDKTDDTSAHPPLYDRDVLAVLPYQVNDHRFAIPAYVMTRNVDKIYDPKAPTNTGARFDMPPEAFQLTMGGFADSGTISARAIDPLNNTSTPVSIVSRSGGTIVLQAELTDSPRVIVIDESAGSTSPPADTTAPSVSLTSPANNAVVTGNTVSLTATASDNVGVDSVQFKLDGNNIGSEVRTAPYGITWDTSAVTDGVHTLTAVAKDAAGNTAISTPVTVTVSNKQAPGDISDGNGSTGSLRGDVTGTGGSPDGKIDLQDISFVIRNYGTHNAKADITGPNSTPDGKIDLFDLSYIIRNYGK